MEYLLLTALFILSLILGFRAGKRAEQKKSVEERLNAIHKAIEAKRMADDPDYADKLWMELKR